MEEKISELKSKGYKFNGNHETCSHGGKAHLHSGIMPVGGIRCSDPVGTLSVDHHMKVAHWSCSKHGRGWRSARLAKGRIVEHFKI